MYTAPLYPANAVMVCASFHEGQGLAVGHGSCALEAVRHIHRGIDCRLDLFLLDQGRPGVAMGAIDVKQERDHHARQQVGLKNGLAVGVSLEEAARKRSAPLAQPTDHGLPDRAPTGRGVADVCVNVEIPFIDFGYRVRGNFYGPTVSSKRCHSVSVLSQQKKVCRGAWSLVAFKITLTGI